MVLIALTFTVAALGIGMFAGGAVAEAWSQATTRQSQPYTELYLINTGQLPTFSLAGKPQQLTFRLANHEAAATTYHYRALMTIDTVTQVVGEGDITLDSEASQDTKVVFTVPRPEVAAQIVIQLVGRSEYLTFEAKS